MESAAGACGAGAGSECEGEDPEDSSSPSHEAVDPSEALQDLCLEDEAEAKPEPVDELSAFREQWQRELDSTPSPQREVPAPEPELPLSDDEKAKQLFLRGVELERSGALYEAIQHYKRAMQIMPDVETRLYDSTEQRDSPEAESEPEESNRVECAPLSEDEDAVEGEDLLARLQRLVARKGRLCEQEYYSKGAHLSWLPYEVVLLVLRWVVSSELDAASLERVAATCRGLYVAARDHDLWRAICVKTWGIECGTPRAAGYQSWREMYVERPRLHLHGCYISKATYLRHGENSFQDHFYRPWYLVDYYRYLRFFPEGVVLMWTTPEEPAACVGHLKSRAVRNGLGIMAGHYRLVADKVVIVVKKCNEKKPPAATHTRFRARRKDVAEQHEQTFHCELQLRRVRGRRNHQLAWTRYAVCARRDQWTQFDLTPAKFPPFAFSRVRAYTAEASGPLTTSYA